MPKYANEQYFLVFPNSGENSLPADFFWLLTLSEAKSSTITNDYFIALLNKLNGAIRQKMPNNAIAVLRRKWSDPQIDENYGEMVMVMTYDMMMVMLQCSRKRDFGQTMRLLLQFKHILKVKKKV